MNFNEYQKKAFETAIYPDKGNNFVYPCLGLAGEAGEFIEEVKKILRDSNYKIDEVKKENLKKEMGDVLWYLAALCTELKFEFDEVAEKNIMKLSLRKEKGTIHGSGDNR